MKYQSAAMKTIFVGLFTLGLILALCTNSTAAQKPSAGKKLKPPFDIAGIRARAGALDDKAFACKTPPSALQDLQFESIYGEKSKNRSVIDPKAYDSYIQDTAPINKFQNGLTGMANRYLKSDPHRPEIAACTLNWLAAWARDDALLGAVNHTGEFVRKWALAPIALSYIQIKDDPSLSRTSKKNVEAWIGALSKTVMGDFTREAHKDSRQNNHLYWAAWGVASASVALNDKNMFDWAMSKAKFGIYQIEPDGTLPLEIARGRMALNYHVFAANPLILLAETGAVNNVDLYGENDRALERLGARILEGSKNPAYFKTLTGQKQDISRAFTATNLSWLTVYNARYPNPQARVWLDKFGTLKNTRLGGDATLLYGP